MDDIPDSMEQEEMKLADYLQRREKDQDRIADLYDASCRAGEATQAALRELSYVSSAELHRVPVELDVAYILAGNHRRAARRQAEAAARYEDALIEYSTRYGEDVP